MLDSDDDDEAELVAKNISHSITCILIQHVSGMNKIQKKIHANILYILYYLMLMSLPVLSDSVDIDLVASSLNIVIELIDNDGDKDGDDDDDDDGADADDDDDDDDDDRS